MVSTGPNSSVSMVAYRGSWAWMIVGETKYPVLSSQTPPQITSAPLSVRAASMYPFSLSYDARSMTAPMKLVKSATSP